MIRIRKQALTRPQRAQLQGWLYESERNLPAGHPVSYHNRLDGTITTDASSYAEVMRYVRIARNK